MVGIETRAARAVDAEAIARVHVESWRVGYRGLLADNLLADLSISKREQMWRERLLGGDNEAQRRVYVAVERETIVGFVSAGPSRDEQASAGDGEIYAIYVRPDRWSAGVGRALMRSAVDFLVAIEVTAAVLWVLASNERARRFYELLGWTCDGRTRTRSLTGPTDDVQVAYEVEEACFRRSI